MADAVDLGLASELCTETSIARVIKGVFEQNGLNLEARLDHYLADAILRRPDASKLVGKATVGELEKVLQHDETLLGPPQDYSPHRSTFASRLFAQCWNRKKYYITLGGLIIINVFLFVWAGFKWIDEAFYKMLGPALLWAKGFAYITRLMFAIVLFTMSRFTVTFLRAIPGLRHLLPLDDLLKLHKFCAITGMLAALGHMMCHLTANIWNWTDPDNDDYFFEEFPDLDEQPTMRELLTSWEVVSGVIAMLLLLAIQSLAILNKWLRKKRSKSPFANFKYFIFTHEFLAITFSIFFIFHPLPNLWHVNHYSSTWIWILGPLLLYIMDVILRVLARLPATATVSYMTRVNVLPGPTVNLHLHEPETKLRIPFKHRPGQFAYILIPAMSRLEWHPFSISSAPEEKQLQFHIRSFGDWTEALVDLCLQEGEYAHQKYDDGDGQANVIQVKTKGWVWGSIQKLQNSVTCKGYQVVPNSVGGEDIEESKVARSPTSVFKFERDIEEEVNVLKPYAVYLHGPFGSALQEWQADKFDVAVLVATGVGITPFASVLKHLVYQKEHHNLKQVYLMWVVREQQAAACCQDVWGMLSDSKTAQQMMDLRVYLSTVKPKSSADAAWLNAVRTASLSTPPYVDAITSVKNPPFSLHYGRPNWDNFMGELRGKHSGSYIGVFFCGAPPVAKEVERKCYQYSDIPPWRTGKTIFRFAKDTVP